MTDVPARSLRNDTRGVLRRVEAGEDVTITIDGRPVAVLRPLRDRRRWLGRTDVVARLTRAQADAGLAADLAELAGESTDDLAL